MVTIVFKRGRLCLQLDKLPSLFILALICSACYVVEANAASLDINCRVVAGGVRSAIKLFATGLNGQYYAKVISGNNIMQTEAKTTNGKGIVGFTLHSDLNYVIGHRGTLHIAPDFIKKRDVVGILRKAGTNARVGAIRAKCRYIKHQLAGSP
jgi:hypothetical protein